MIKDTLNTLFPLAGWPAQRADEVEIPFWPRRFASPKPQWHRWRRWGWRRAICGSCAPDVGRKSASTRVAPRRHCAVGAI